jgi:hypothetical protein
MSDLDLFGTPVTEEVVLKKGAWMRAHFGTAQGCICRDCQHLKWHDAGSRLYPKCLLYGDSACSATDWNSRGVACGRYVRAAQTQRGGTSC